MDLSSGLPEDISTNLHSPVNITLRLLRLQEGDVKKSLKHKFAALAAGAVMATSAAAATPTDKAPSSPASAYTPVKASKWTPDGMDEDMRPIAKLESNNGKMMEHAPHSKGEFHTAFGAVGFKPVTAHEEYKRTPYLQKLFPNLHDESKFLSEFKSNPSFYNHVASAHWRRLKKLAGGNSSRTAYAWRWGQGMMARTDPAIVNSDPYVQAFAKLHAERMPQVAMKHTFETAVGDWLQKSITFFRTKDGASIPASSNPERADFDSRYLAKAEQLFVVSGTQRLVPIKVETAKLHGYNLPVMKERVRLYERMLKAGETLPPIIVRRSGDLFSLLDGNHRQKAAESCKQILMDALELVDEPRRTDHSLKLYDMSRDELNLLQPRIVQTENGQMYEPSDFDAAIAQLRRLGYQGYRGSNQSPTAVSLFTEEV